MLKSKYSKGSYLGAIKVNKKVKYLITKWMVIWCGLLEIMCLGIRLWKRCWLKYFAYNCACIRPEYPKLYKPNCVYYTISICMEYI